MPRRSSSRSIRRREPWVLSIDADEWLDGELRTTCRSCRCGRRPSPGWQLRRTLTLYGRAGPVSLWTRPERMLRLVRRGRAHFDSALIVHEGLIVEGETESPARPPPPRTRPAAR